MKKKGYRENTIVSRVKMLQSLARIADLSDPGKAKAVIAELIASEGRKEKLVCVYAGFCRQYRIMFERPTYRRIEQLPFTPVESEIDHSIIIERTLK